MGPAWQWGRQTAEESFRFGGFASIAAQKEVNVEKALCYF